LPPKWRPPISTLNKSRPPPTLGPMCWPASRPVGSQFCGVNCGRRARVLRAGGRPAGWPLVVQAAGRLNPSPARSAGRQNWTKRRRPSWRPARLERPSQQRRAPPAAEQEHRHPIEREDDDRRQSTLCQLASQDDILLRPASGRPLALSRRGAERATHAHDPKNQAQAPSFQSPQSIR